MMGTLKDIMSQPPKRTGEPQPDMARCSECEGEWPIASLEVETGGDGEGGFEFAHLCPKCDDGGCIDSYFMSPKRTREWRKWERSRKLK